MTPPLPSLRALTRELRALHAAWGGEYACLYRNSATGGFYVSAVSSGNWRNDPAYGREYVPGSVERVCPKCNPPHRWIGYDAWGGKCSGCNGSGKTSAPSPFDATAAARRLLAAAREAGCK
jgi:hypothetical protein